MTNPNALARLAVEVYRSSGERTPERLQHLVRTYAQTYFGPSAQWPTAIMELVADAQMQAAQIVRPVGVR